MGAKATSGEYNYFEILGYDFMIDQVFKVLEFVLLSC